MAALATILGFYVVNAIQEAQQTSEKQTLVTLNDQLNKMKCEGGGTAALTQGAPISNVLAAMKTEVDWAGMKHQFLGSRQTYFGRSLSALGNGVQYRFTRFNTYTAEPGGKCPGPAISSGLVGRWLLSSASGAADSSGNNNNGSAQGGLAMGTATDENGIANAATSFDDSDTTGYISITTTSSLSTFPSGLTYSVWIYPLAYDLDGGYVRRILSTSGDQDFGIQNGASFYRCLSGGVQKSFLGDAIISLNAWNHVAVVHSTSGVTFYTNGTTGTLQAQLGGIDPVAANYTLGKHLYHTTGRFKGLMSDLRIYNRALSAAEVQAIYNGQ